MLDGGLFMLTHGRGMLGYGRGMLANDQAFAFHLELAAVSARFFLNSLLREAIH